MNQKLIQEFYRMECANYSRYVNSYIDKIRNNQIGEINYFNVIVLHTIENHFLSNDEHIFPCIVILCCV